MSKCFAAWEDIKITEIPAKSWHQEFCSFSVTGNAIQKMWLHRVSTTCSLHRESWRSQGSDNRPVHRQQPGSRFLLHWQGSRPLMAGWSWVFSDEMYTVTRVPRDHGDVTHGVAEAWYFTKAMAASSLQNSSKTITPSSNVMWSILEKADRRSGNSTHWAGWDLWTEYVKHWLTSGLQAPSRAVVFWLGEAWGWSLEYAEFEPSGHQQPATEARF